MCKQIIALIMCLVICFSLLSSVALASFESDSYVYTTTGWDDALISISYALGGEVPILSPILEMLAYYVSPNEVCPMSENKRHSGKAIGFGARSSGSFGAFPGTYPLVCRCDWCGETFTVDVNADEFSDDFGAAYDDYVSTLPPDLDCTSSGTTMGGTVGVNFADTMEELSFSEEFWSSISLYESASLADCGQGLLVFQNGDGGFYYGLFKVYNEYFGFDMLKSDAVTSLAPYSSADFPIGCFTSFNSFTSYSFSYSSCYFDSSRSYVYSIFLNYSDAAAAYGAHPQDVFLFTY